MRRIVERWSADSSGGWQVERAVGVVGSGLLSLFLISAAAGVVNCFLQRWFLIFGGGRISGGLLVRLDWRWAVVSLQWASPGLL